MNTDSHRWIGARSVSICVHQWFSNSHCFCARSKFDRFVNFVRTKKLLNATMVTKSAKALEIDVGRAEGPAVNSPASQGSLRRSRSGYVICALLLLALGASYVAAISRKTLTNDELVHIPAGYYYWTLGDFQLNNEHPPLVKLWASLPVLLLSKAQPIAPASGAPQDRWDFYGPFWRQRAQDFQSLAFWPRIMMVPVTLALGLLIFLYARKLFGMAAGLFALAFFCLEPTMLAHGRIVHTDVPGALAYLAFFFLLHRYIERASFNRAVWLGAGSGLATITKFSMIVLVPLLPLTFLVQTFRSGNRERTRPALHFGAALLMVLLVINVAYFFERPPLNATDRAITAGQSQQPERILSWIGALAKGLPTYFLFGAYNVAAHNQYGHMTSLLGMQGTKGWWYYFPVAFTLKTTISFLFISIVSLVWSVYRVVRDRSIGHAAVLAPIALYCAVAMTSRINIGVRHFLPVFPFLFILGGGFLQAALIRRRSAGVALAAVVLAWSLFEAVRVFPDYTAYVNQLARGPEWRYLSDSNVEWGDDVQDLATYLKSHGITRIRGALLGGWLTLSYLGVEYLNLFAEGEPPPETGYVAIGASFLNGSTVPFGGPNSGRETDEQRANYFATYRNRVPEAIFGRSIYLYRIGNNREQ